MRNFELYTRMMVQQYQLQLTTARRLARFRRARDPEPPPDPSIQREQTVQRTAHELYETLLFTGTDNPMVDRITQKLSDMLGGTIRLSYPLKPLGSEQLSFVRDSEDPANPPMRLSAAEQNIAMALLWDITLETVDESTL